jgi:hypothetical protein
VSTSVPRRRRVRKIVLAFAIGLVAACVAGELALRFFLFNTSAFAIEHGKGFREVNFYGDRASDDDVWKLEWLMNDAGRLHDAPFVDRKLGWTATVAPGTYAHPDATKVGARTPVLLYGDSFAQGATGPDASFQSLLASSDLSPTHALINYGAGGYGLDQTFLLVRATIDQWKDPIVLVGCFVDDDLDRSVLAFRSWPKPRFTLEGKKLVEPAPVETDIHEFLDAHPLAIKSYLWRFVKYRRNLLPRAVQTFLRGDERRIEEKKALNRAILVALHKSLEEKGMRHAVVAFLGENGLTYSPGCEWQEAWLTATCREIGLPLVSVRADFQSVPGADATRWKPYFMHETGARGHYDDSGNRLAFQALRRAIEGRFE